MHTPSFYTIVAYASCVQRSSVVLVIAFYDEGLPGMEAEAARYTEAMTMLESCPVPREQLMAEKADIYQQLAEVNRRI